MSQMTDEEMAKRRIRTFKGVLCDRDSVIKISDGRWCNKDEVVTIVDKTFHVEDKFIVKDCVAGNYIHKDYAQLVVTKIIDKNPKIEFEIGYTIQEVNPIHLRYKGVGYQVLSIDVISKTKADIVEDYKLGIFVHKSEFKEHDKYATYQEFDNIQKKTKDPNHNMKFGLDSLTHLITEGKKASFGVELESAKGIMPHYLRDKFNIKCVYDGSLRADDGNVYGGEYVTGVLRGDKGFEHLQDLCSQLSRRCTTDSKGGLHIHNGVTPTQDFIVSLYMLCQLVEEEMFSIIPQSRRKSLHCKKLNKFVFDFKKLKGKEDYKNRIDLYYETIYKHYTTKNIKPGNSYNKLKHHPLGSNGKCGFNHDTPRYCWLNLIPALFLRDNPSPMRERRTTRRATTSRRRDSFANSGEYLQYMNTFFRNNNTPTFEEDREFEEVEEKDEKYDGYTAEIRIFPPSLNFSKIKNHIKLCQALVYYAENHQGDIIKADKISLSEVIMKAYPKRGGKLVRFIEDRKDLFMGKAEKEDKMEVITDRKPMMEVILS